MFYQCERSMFLIEFTKMSLYMYYVKKSMHV